MLQRALHTSQKFGEDPSEPLRGNIQEGVKNHTMNSHRDKRYLREAIRSSMLPYFIKVAYIPNHPFFCHLSGAGSWLQQWLNRVVHISYISISFPVPPGGSEGG